MPPERKNGDRSTVPVDASPSAEAAAAEAQPPVESLDVDPDADEASDSYDSLVAAVAEMSDQPVGRAAAENVRPSEPVAEIEEAPPADAPAEEDSAA